MKQNGRSGQSLVELLVAIVVGVVMVIGATTAIAPALRSNTTAIRLQVSTGLSKELLDNTRVLAESNWPLIAGLTTGPATTYYVNATGSPFTVSTGTENVVVATTTYIRYFYIENVGRGAGYISGAANDPSTKKITIVSGISTGPTSSLSTYLMRTRNTVWHQTDWSGGPDEEGVLTSPNTRFSTSSNMDSTLISGSLLIESVVDGRDRYLHFDGDDDYVQLPSDIFDSITEGTIEAWVLVDDVVHGGPPSGASPEMRWFYNGNVTDGSGYCTNSNDCLEMHVVDGQAGFGIQVSGGDSYESGAEIGIGPYTGVWQHIALVVSSSTGNTLYINGSVPADLDYWTDNGTAATKLFFDDVAASTTQVLIGNGELSDMDDGTYNAFYGGIDEVRVWNRPLTQSEVRRNMYRELTGSETGLIGYWQFDEGSGQTARDISSGGHDGTLGMISTSTDDHDPTWVVTP